MSSPVWCVRPEDDAAHARKEMVTRGVIKLVVVDEDEKPVGVVTATDLLVDGTDLHKSPERRAHLTTGAVKNVMTRRLFTVDPETQAGTVARELVRRDVGAAPVVEDDRLVGIVTPTDVLDAVREGLEGRSMVREAMMRDFPKAHRHDSLASVTESIMRTGSRAAVVTESNSSDGMVGLVTRESLVFGHPFEPAPSASRFRGEKRLKETRKRDFGGRKDARHVEVVRGVAEDLMLTDVPTIQHTAGAETAANVLLHENARVLPVVEGEAVVGLLTKRDLIKAYARIVA